LIVELQMDCHFSCSFLFSKRLNVEATVGQCDVLFDELKWPKSIQQKIMKKIFIVRLYPAAID
jgi:hypothetical protein